jgi:hypothetical protein
MIFKHAAKSSKVPKQQDISEQPTISRLSNHIQRFKLNPKSLAHDEVQELQSGIGNAALVRLLKSAEQSENVHNKPGERKIQRKAVYMVGTDSIVTDSYARLTEKGETRVNDLAEAGGDKKELLKNRLGPDEELVIIGHGNGRGHIEGMDTKALLQRLRELGFDPKLHKGPINLFSCFSGVSLYGTGVLFADEFSKLLQAEGFSNPVIGYKGYVLPLGEKIKVVPMQFKDKYDGLKIALEKRRQIPNLNQGFKEAMEEAIKAKEAGNLLMCDDWLNTAKYFQDDIAQVWNAIEFASKNIDSVSSELNDDVVKTYYRIPNPDVDMGSHSDTMKLLLATATVFADSMQQLANSLKGSQTDRRAELLIKANDLANSLKALSQTLAVANLESAAEKVEISSESLKQVSQSDKQ